MLLLIIILILVFGVGGLPTWGYANWGYGPSGLLGVVLIVLLIYMLVGHRLM